MNVPFHKQCDDHTCGPAVLQMVFKHFGIHETQEKLARVLETTESRGTSHEAMVRVARQYGFSCHTKIRSSAKDVERFLAKNLPVIVNYIDPVSDDGHYAIIVDTNGTEFTMNDPENGMGFKMNIREFEKRWYNSTRRSKGWLMVMSPKVMRK